MRADLQYEMFLAMHERLYHAPLHAIEPKRVLDMGTGKGAWAIEFGSSTHLRSAAGAKQ